MRFTRAQLQEDIEFLLHRSTEAGRFSFNDHETRTVGRSSNELVRLAYTGEHRGEHYMPLDYSDAGACARTWALLPVHRQTTPVHRKLMEGIEKVRAKHGARANGKNGTDIAKAERKV